MSKQKVYVVRYRHCTEIRYSDLVGVGDSLDSAMALARRAHDSDSVLKVHREHTLRNLGVDEWLLEIWNDQYHIEGMEVQDDG